MPPLGPMEGTLMGSTSTRPRRTRRISMPSRCWRRHRILIPGAHLSLHQLRLDSIILIRAYIFFGLEVDPRSTFFAPSPLFLLSRLSTDSSSFRRSIILTLLTYLVGTSRRGTCLSHPLKHSTRHSGHWRTAPTDLRRRRRRKDGAGRSSNRS